jgi:hypothetical protein
MKRIGLAAALTALMSALTLAAPAAALVTIGANVTDTSNTSASTIGCVPDCTFVALADDPPQPMQAPCAGTVTKWRVNVAASNVVFRLRVVRDNGDGTYTSTASSAAQSNAFPSGVVTFPTSVPIAAGEYLGVDLTAGGVILGRDFTSGDNIFRPPMVDGLPQAVLFSGSDVLVNADIACASAPAGPTSAGPTGQRAAALKKCKKKLPRGTKRKKCIKKAKKLPV